MPSPVDQLTALAKANLEFSLKLAEILRGGGEHSFEARRKAAARLADAFPAAAKLLAERDKADPGTLLQGTADLFSELEKIRGDMTEQTRAAFDEWRRQWTEIAATQGSASPFAGFAALFNPWPGSGEAKPASDSATKSSGS